MTSRECRGLSSTTSKKIPTKGGRLSLTPQDLDPYSIRRDDLAGRKPARDEDDLGLDDEDE